VKRELFDEDHEAFRAVVREFVAREVTPHIERWEENRLIDRDVWLAAGKQGILGLTAPELLGGGGGDYRYRMVVHEELGKVFASSLASSFSLQDDILIPYVVELGNEEQQQRWLPGMIAGELIMAVAMTEPGTGSDLQGIRTSATKVDGGWVINGSKTFITSGIQSDVVITVCRTDPDGGPQGFTLLAVERDFPGFTRGRKLQKVGLHGQDTAELSFEDVFVPDANMLGEVGGGFGQLKNMLPLERLSIAAWAVGITSAVLAETVDYTKSRTAFGQPIIDFQNTRFELAEMTTELNVTRSFVDDAIEAYNAGQLTDVDAAQAKWWASDVQNRIVDQCVQLHGGYGFMLEYPVGRAYQDSRVQKIFGGTNEIMKHIIGRSIAAGRI
jgi:alkylation response protein AidB-like acyl-CoA dehydrogenase